VRVLLISSNTAITPYPVYPLGCSMIAGALVKAGHIVSQCDFLENESSLESLADRVKDFNPELIGISIRNIDNVNYLSEASYIGTVVKIVATLREVSSAKVVLGGSGFSLIPSMVLEKVGGDYGVIGEGESIMVKFVENAVNGIYPDNKLLGPERKLQMEDIPSAIYDGRLMQYYLKSGNVASVQTKRGCSHKCLYCSYPLLEGKKIRTRNPQTVVDDIEMLSKEHGVKRIFFIDSVFNDDEGTYIEVLKEMKSRKVYISWTAFLKPSGLNEENVALMKETGLKEVELGADATTDTTLKKMGKDFKFKDIVRCNELLAEYDVAMAHFYMFGGPGETKDTVLEGIENIRSLINCAVFPFLGVRILPDTPLANLAVKEGIISADDGLLEPVYYFSPDIDKEWMEKTLELELANIRHCIYPPDSKDSSLKILHKLGYSGALWDMLYSKKKKTVVKVPNRVGRTLEQ